MEMSLQTYGSTQGDISPALARDIHNGSLSNHIFPQSPGLGKIEAIFLSVNEYIHCTLNMVQLKTQDYNVCIFTQGWGWELVWVRHIVVKTTSY